MLSTLWLASKKPNPDSYLRPFVEEGRKLFQEGVTWKDKNGRVKRTRVMVLLSTFDSVARPMFCCMTQYNGFYGCTFCLHPGVLCCSGRGTGTKRCYPVMIPFPPQRTHENTVFLGRQRHTVVFLVLSTGSIVILLGLKVIPSIYILHLVQSSYPLAKL
jgi:hypothetical protein